MHGFVTPVVIKGNCGIPKFQGTTITYSGTPELMAHYATMAMDAGARIVGGCCGTSPEHVAAMRTAIDAHQRGVAPSQDEIISRIGPLTNQAPGAIVERDGRRRRRPS
jgi:5-methyltetrahydrofolate--homocysteine methyltransferase